MTAVQTVRGPVDTGALGRVLMHEHVFVLGTELQQNYPDAWDEEARVDDAVAKLRELKQRGIDTIVDPLVRSPGLLNATGPSLGASKTAASSWTISSARPV